MQTFSIVVSIMRFNNIICLILIIRILSFIKQVLFENRDNFCSSTLECSCPCIVVTREELNLFSHVRVASYYNDTVYIIM